MSREIRHAARALLAFVLAVAGTFGLSGCGEAARHAAKASSNDITIWTHTAGSEAELEGVKQIIRDYNASPDKKATVHLQAFPQSSYNDSVISASSAGNLPASSMLTSLTRHTGHGPMY